MDPTTLAIILTQTPIAIGAFIAAYELYKTRKELIRLLEAISKKKR